LEVKYEKDFNVEFDAGENGYYFVEIGRLLISNSNLYFQVKRCESEYEVKNGYTHEFHKFSIYSLQTRLYKIDFKAFAEAIKDLLDKYNSELLKLEQEFQEGENLLKQIKICITE
jgi:hypothetical protein